jgi:hypothetical protein
MPLDSWAPTVQDVANLLRARTITANGGEVGNFTSATRPNADEVTGLIEQAHADVQDAVGPMVIIPPVCINSATSLVALGAALRIEMSYYPEQVGSGRSPYAQLKKLYDDALKRLQDAIVSLGGKRPTDEYMMPSGDFGGPPIPVGWILPQW